MAFLRRSVLWLLACMGCGLICWWGCGTEGMQGDLQVESWPQSGLGPFRLIGPSDAAVTPAPYVLLVPGVDADGPAAVAPGGAGAGTDALHLWVSASPLGGGPSSIARAEVPSLEQGADGLSPILSADQPWEGGGLFHPTVLTGDAPDFPDLGASLVLLYQGQGPSPGITGSVGLALAGTADGSDLRKAPGPLASAKDLGETALESASAAFFGPVLRLYYLADGVRIGRAEADVEAVRALSQGGQGVAVAGVGWRVLGTVLSAADFVVPISATQSVPAERLSGLSVRRLITPAGRQRVDLYLIAEARGRKVAGAASSYDGASFLTLKTAVLGQGNASGTPTSAAVITYRQRALLLLGYKTVHLGIAAALIR